MTAAERAERTHRADALCADAFAGSGAPGTGVALVAVGGYGRRELAPHSDLDVVLVGDDGVEVGEAATSLWYPLWDSGSKIDHAVRSASQMLEQADADLRVMLGLLDLRHLAGDANLTLRLRSTVLAHWRQQARSRLPELRDLVADRHRLVGELAHLSVPDLKEAEGGLRDATVLKALVATWLVDVPHVDLERSRQAMLDVRDVLHAVAGRGGDRVAPEVWPDLAEGLGLADARAAQVHVRELGRRITHLSRLTWRRVDAVLSGPASVTGPRRPELVPLAPGIALSAGEVVLEAHARPVDDPVLLLRASAVAAEQDAVLAPATAARLARECPPLPTPWPTEARQCLVRLLASGRALLPVWETLEETGALAGFLPEWDRIRLLPHASEIHRFTVDRHVVETCMEASVLIRQVSRPDVLMVAALLHDIGKGGTVEHSAAGEPIAREVAARMGFDAEGIDLVATLVRHHLLLARAATTRDPEDPATTELLTDAVGSPEALSLLAALTEADARATAPQAWTTWRAGLIHGLAERARNSLRLEGMPVTDPPDEVQIPSEAVHAGWHLAVERRDDGTRVTVVGRDRVGLLSDVAATFALQRIAVRAARAWPQEHDGVAYGVSVWEVATPDLDAAVLRQHFEGVLEGRLDPATRLKRPGVATLAATADVRPDASQQSTVLEVRAADRPGVVYRVCSALAGLGIAVRSAHVDTLGPQAVDVFYLHEPGGGVLNQERARAATQAVLAALSGAG